MSDDGVAIGAYWKEHPHDELPEWCDGCPFVAAVLHGGEDGCSVFSNYADICTITQDEKETVGAVFARLLLESIRRRT